MDRSPLSPLYCSDLTDDLSNYSDALLVEAVTELAAHLNAAEHRLVELIAELDVRADRGRLGQVTTAQWLGFQCGIDSNTAREKVRVGRALRALPVLRACFARGEVSYSKVRALTRIATADNESLLLGYARAATAAQIEKIVRGYRQLERVTDPETVLRHRRARGLHWHFDDDGMLVLHGRFPPEDGALILKAIEAMRDRMYRDERAAEAEEPLERAHGRVDDAAEHPVRARKADAFVRIAETALAQPEGALTGGERTLVVMHVPASGNCCELEDGAPLPHETARRIACDASVVTQRENENAGVVSIGRRSRTVPHWMRRALKRRDGGCRFPGCTRTQHVDAHHVVHWAEGGETSLDNLVLLCRHHHRLVHEHGYGCATTEDGDFRFSEPDGTRIPEAFPQKRGTCLELVRLNAHRGLNIGPKTCAPGWDGRRVDYGEAVGAVWEVTKATRRVPPPRGPRSEPTWSRA